ncbi:MAG: carboxypeptidase regulatory-like domain-containing protein, partial [Candidatus Eremiobacteraeota bacterium]|nr:carboxypeptidase regulatory-like domain-containing protein [Candidatus Eremiobacteraeota bacterium]
MSKRFGLLRPVVAVLLALFLLCQGTWALAGTTGTLSGTVTDEKGAPVAGATVTVSSPSQTVSTTSQSNGHYVFLSLAPDTYTIAVNKEGAIQPYSQGGIAVFADQTQTQDLRVASVNLKEIARVTSRAANDLVKAGTTSDIYSVNAATAEKVGAIGGGTNLNSAYSALASQPGVLVGYGGIGWGQQIFIHGASYSQVGYELDGVPVNRAFDNYNANSLSNLGQQELQIVTSGAPSNSSSQTVGGFINQVIRTGTYPGFGTVNAGIAGPTYYHQMKAEAGGAMPNRLFSYYVGFLGSNQDYKPYDNFMGGTGIPGLTPIMSGLQTNTGQTAGMFPFCVASPGGPGAQIGIADVPANQLNPAIFPAGTAPGCEAGPFPAALGSTSSYTDREAVANFHIGIPHHNDSGRDDVQILYDGSYQNNAFYSSINDHGGIQTYCGM